MSKALFGVAQPNQNKNNIVVVVLLVLLLLLLLKEVLGHINRAFNKMFSFKHEPLFKIFNFAIFFLL